MYFETQKNDFVEHTKHDVLPGAGSSPTVCPLTRHDATNIDCQKISKETFQLCCLHHLLMTLTTLWCVRHFYCITASFSCFLPINWVEVHKTGKSIIKNGKSAVTQTCILMAASKVEESCQNCADR